MFSNPSFPRGPTQRQIKQRSMYMSTPNLLFNLSLCRSPGKQRLIYIYIVLLTVPVAVLTHNEVRSRSAGQAILCVATCCPRGSLLLKYSKEQISCLEHQACASRCAQRQSCAIMKGGADQLDSFFFISLLTVPEAVWCLKKMMRISSPQPQHCSVGCPNVD